VKLSIIVPVHNELQYTRWCLLSLVNRTKVQHEIIIVNDKSDEKTTDFLKKFSQEYNCRYFETGIRRGWHSGSCNLGIEKSVGEYICLLNSDTIVPTDWEKHLIDFLESPSGKNISVVGPSTSYCASHQKIPYYHDHRYEIKYNETEDVAKDVYEKYKGQSLITRVTGFCMFFHRNMLTSIGMLDEEQFPSAGNESDWIIRGLLKNYKPCWVRYAYIHHFGQASYVKAIGREEKMERWRAADDRLIQKHGKHVYDVIQKAFWKNQHPTY